MLKFEHLWAFIIGTRIVNEKWRRTKIPDVIAYYMIGVGLSLWLRHITWQFYAWEKFLTSHQLNSQLLVFNNWSSIIEHLLVPFEALRMVPKYPSSWCHAVYFGSVIMQGVVSFSCEWTGTVYIIHSIGNILPRTAIGHKWPCTPQSINAQ